MTLHHFDRVESSWPNGYGKGLFVKTVTCSCGLSFESSDTNDYYDLSVESRAFDKWGDHARSVNVGVLELELAQLPDAYPAVRLIVENELNEWAGTPRERPTVTYA